MPARHRERYSAAPPKMFTFSLESCSRCAGISVHVAVETPNTMDRNMQHAAAVRALELDRNLADAHLALTRFLATIDWNVDTAELEVNKTRELNPRNLQALRLASELASTRGQTDRALDFASKAIVNDP